MLVELRRVFGTSERKLGAGINPLAFKPDLTSKELASLKPFEELVNHAIQKIAEDKRDQGVTEADKKAAIILAREIDKDWLK